MKTKALAVSLAVAMLLLFAACGGSPSASDSVPSGSSPGTAGSPSTLPSASIDPGFDYTGGLPDGVVTTEPITLKAFQRALDNQSTDFPNLWYYEKLKEMTDVSIDFTVIKESDWSTQLNLMWSSNDKPDLLIRPTGGLNFEDYGVLQKLIVPLDGYIQANMPNYSSRLNLNRAGEIMRSSDGNTYYIGYLNAQGVVNNAHFFINKTWLSKVGKAVPTTVDELTDVLRAFRDQKPGTGNNTYPMSAGGDKPIVHQTNGIYNYFSMFGVPVQRWVYGCIQDDGTVVFPAYIDGFREACEWLAMCYAEGLLDPESLTQGDSGRDVKVNADEVGFTTYLRLINTAWTNPDTTQNWEPILPPAAAGHSVKIPRDISTDLPEIGAVILKDNKYIPQTLRWLDAQFEPSMMFTAANGPADGNGPIAQCIEEGADGVWRVLYVPDNNALYNYVPVTQGQFFAPGDWIFTHYEMAPHRWERYENSQSYEKAGIVEKNSYHILYTLVQPNPDQATQLSRTFDDIENVMITTLTDFIMNGVTDAKWNAFMNELKDVDVDGYISIYQQLYNNYAAGQ